METEFKLNTWFGLFSLSIILLACYWVLRLAKFLVEKIAIRNVTNKRIITVINRALLLFKPVGVMLLLLGFISINYVTHTILLLMISVFGYHHIKNYIFGLFLKMNPLIKEGAILQIGNLAGQLKRFLPFGVVFNTEKGECYINYSSIEQKEFAVNSNNEDVLRQTLFLDTKLSQEAILDLLFDNPIIDFNEKPIIKFDDSINVLKLQYTLENGASTQDLIAFFKAHNINTTTKI